MKRLLILAFVLLLFSSAAHAVTWRVVSISAVVSQGGPSITNTVLTSRSYMALGASRFGVADKNDVFVGFREDTGQVALVQISTKTVLYSIISGFGTGGTAANALNTKGTVALPATVSSLNTDFSGYVFDSFTRKPTGALSTVTRLFIGGLQTQTFKGTIKITNKKFEL